MSVVIVEGNRTVLLCLLEQLQKQVPRLEPKTVNGQLLAFAYRDLKKYLETKWEKEDSLQTRRRLRWYSRNHPRELEAFLSLWAGWWVEKWRQRVKILHKDPKIPKRNKKRAKKARELYRELKHKEELKNMVINRLIDQGEICMPSQIAEALTMKEIRRRLPPGDDKSVNLNPVKILCSLSSRITTLSEKKSPLIHLRIRPRSASTKTPTGKTERKKDTD